MVPPQGAGGFSYPSKARGKRTRPSSNVLKIDWKLPARLRKPVRAQLKAERAERRSRVLKGFYRRPLNTQRLTTEVNRGAEQHTGDIYRESEPQLRLVAPPYTGSVMRTTMHQQVGEMLPARRVSPAPTPTPAPEVRGVIAQPRRRLRLPFSIQIFPKGLLPNSYDDTTGASGLEVAKKKIFPAYRNLAILLVGCLLTAGVVWNLQGAGQGWRVLGRVQEQAELALSRAGNAQAALAEANFAESEAAFADAEALLSTARGELDTALSTSRHVLQVVDVTGTVRSGEALLTGGEALTQAGQHISRGMAALLAAEVLPGEAAPKGATLVDAIEATRGEFIQAQTLLESAEKDFSRVASPLLPESVRADVERLSASVPTVRAAVEQFINQTDTLLFLLGAQRERQYLLLFANNHELRPVGGFIGSLGLISVDRGAVEEVDVQTVYDGDGQLKEFIAPPDPLTPIVNRWYLRDSNWFVDYSVSAAKAAQFFEKEGGPTVDGVILLTPDVIRELVGVAGPIEVPGYDVTVSGENFTEVTQREVTYEYDRAANRPKQFLADLTPLLLNRLLATDGVKSLEVLSALTRNLARKDMVFYFRDKELQAQVAKLGWAGKLPPAAPGFLLVNNANIGGHKSDQFVDQEIDYRLQLQEDGTAEAVVTIRRTHHGPTEGGAYTYPAGENPAGKDNVVFQRLLAPAGSRLLEAQGFMPSGDIPRLVAPELDAKFVADADVAEWQRAQTRHQNGTILGTEAGYTFFGNWLVTKPGQTTVGLYRYRLPEKFDMPGMLDEAGRVSVYLAKQPGQIRTTLRVEIHLPETLRVHTTAPESGVTPVSDSQFTYRGELSRDVVVGGVFERK